MRKIVPAFIAIASILLAGCACAGETAVALTPEDTATVSAELSPEPDATPLPIDVSLYLPNADFTGLTAVSAQAEDSPRGLLAALVGAGALPDVNYGTNITFGVDGETVSTEDGEVSGIIVRLDLSDAFAQAVRQSGAQKEALLLQSLVNTFLVRYEADAMILTIEGTVLETPYGKYEAPMTFDEFASTSRG